MAELHDFLSMLTKNLEILEERARRYSMLPKEQLQTLLQPHMKAEREKIQSLEGKELLDSTEQRLLAIHQHNLELYQQILTGERPYAPLELLNQINDHKEAINLTEQAIEQNISFDDLQAKLSSLNLLVARVVFVAQEPPRKSITGQMTKFEDILDRLTKNLAILKERQIKYGDNAPLDLLNQIEDHHIAIERTNQVIAGQISEIEWKKALRLFDVLEQEDSQSSVDLTIFLNQLKENLSVLEIRRKKYGVNVPRELLNQIDDHYTAIDLTERVIDGEISEAEWREGLNPLLIAASPGSVINISIS